MKSKNFDFLQVNSFSYIDIGSANFESTKFDQFEKKLSITLFEPDPRSAKELRGQGYKVFEFGLSDTEKELNLFLTKKPECSSTLKPNREIIDLYPNSDRFDVSNVCSISCKTLDSIENLAVDFIKIDVQGHELPVLMGAKEKLRGCLGIEVEVYFREFYECQPLFADIDSFLRECGFELMDIKNQKYFARDGYYGAGELIFGDAVYVKNIDNVSDKCTETIHKLFMIHFAYDNFSVAERLIESIDQAANLVLKKARKSQFNVLLREYWLKRFGIIR